MGLVMARRRHVMTDTRPQVLDLLRLRLVLCVDLDTTLILAMAVQLERIVCLVQITVLVVEAVVLVAIRLRVSARLAMAAMCHLDVLHVSLQRRIRYQRAISAARTAIRMQMAVL